jgi:hypothetical protein
VGTELNGICFVQPLALTRSQSSKKCGGIHNYFIRSEKRAYHRKRGILKLQSDDSSLDPYKILEIPLGTTDKAIIKRAYRRMAMKFHPDVVNSMNAQGKQAANDKFIKINAAYELLSGKTAAQSGKSNTHSTKASTSTGYQPPHRRSYSSTKSSSSTASSSRIFSDDLRDYIPQDSGMAEESYDTDGDSFGSIFSDFLVGLGRAASSGASTGKGLLMDLIDFLEGNFPEYGTSVTVDQDAALDTVLQSNDAKLLREELYDTTLLIKQLSAKLASIDQVINSLEVEKNAASNFLQKEMKDEDIGSWKGRKSVVEDYLRRGRQRLIKIQKRILEVKDSPCTSPGSEGLSYARTNSGEFHSTNDNSIDTSRASTAFKSSASVRKENFGAFGRGRPRSRSFDFLVDPPDSPLNSELTSQKPLIGKSPDKKDCTNSGSFGKLPNDDRKRLRELEVDDEFEKLKRELGL